MQFFKNLIYPFKVYCCMGSKAVELSLMNTLRIFFYEHSQYESGDVYWEHFELIYQAVRYLGTTDCNKHCVQPIWNQIIKLIATEYIAHLVFYQGHILQEITLVEIKGLIGKKLFQMKLELFRNDKLKYIHNNYLN